MAASEKGRQEVTPHEQVTVSLFLAESGSPKNFRRSRKWAAAIARAAQELKKQKASRFVELPLNHPDGVVAWTVVTRGVPYRCMYWWDMWLLPAGWKARVDVGYTT